jgi:hypothetical protein
VKTITLYVPEDQYAAFQKYAKRTGSSASELIRSAMSEYYGTHIARDQSVFDSEPASVGRVLKPLIEDDDLLDEMLQ